jgi:hypothetical protein
MMPMEEELNCSGKRSSRQRTMQSASCASRVLDHDLSDSSAYLKAVRKGGIRRLRAEREAYVCV